MSSVTVGLSTASTTPGSVGSSELITPGVVSVAQIYVRQFVMPNDAQGDALHLALASFYACDYLLTWNCKHLANARKADHIEQVNRRLGLHVPRIVTPEQLMAPDT